ncbi:MAG: hypothetical protein K9K67_07665 [Bacteriovoracaceae bacterium]|nr:hypothetical protein [Bacteriovoracaceae bacterium]
MKYTISLIFTLLFHLPLLASGLDGEYKSICFPYSDGRSFESSVLIQGQSFGGKFSLYEDNRCQTLLLIIDYAAEVNYPVALGIGPMDHKIKNALMVVFSPKVRDQLMREGTCSTGDIKIGTPINIEGKIGCGPQPIPKAGTILFDMYEKKETGLTFGAFPLLWVSEEEKRPTLTGSVIYHQK